MSNWVFSRNSSIEQLKLHIEVAFLREIGLVFDRYMYVVGSGRSEFVGTVQDGKKKTVHFCLKSLYYLDESSNQDQIQYRFGRAGVIFSDSGATPFKHR